MSNLSELITDVHDKDSSSLNQIGALAGTIADLAATFGAVGSVVGIVEQLMPAKSDLMGLLDAVGAMFSQVNDHIKAGDALARFRQIDTAVGKAQAVLDTLKAFVDAKGAGTLDAVQQITACREAVDDLSAQSAWLTVFVDEIYYDDTFTGLYNYPIPNGNDIEEIPLGPAPPPDAKFVHPVPSKGLLVPVHVGWGQVQPKPDANGLVFTYLYVLASWMYAEAVFLTVAAALDKQFAAHYGSVLTSDANFLQSMHDNIVSGIQDLCPYPPYAEWDVPDLASGLYGQGFSPILDDINTVVGTRIDYGALDVYSGLSQMATYQLMNQELSQDGTLPSNPKVNQKFRIRLLKQRKLLYTAIGLPAVARLIQRLRSITKPVPNYGDWSFKEICGIAGTTSLLDVKKLIQSTPPSDTPSLGASGFRALLS